MSIDNTPRPSREDEGDPFFEKLADEIHHRVVASLKPTLQEITGKPKSTEPDNLLTREDVAKRLNCSVRTVDTLVARGDLQVIKIRRCIRFSPDAIDAYLRRVAGAKQ